MKVAILADSVVRGGHAVPVRVEIRWAQGDRKRSFRHQSENTLARSVGLIARRRQGPHRSRRERGHGVPSLEFERGLRPVAHRGNETMKATLVVALSKRSQLALFFRSVSCRRFLP